MTIESLDPVHKSFESDLDLNVKENVRKISQFLLLMIKWTIKLINCMDKHAIIGLSSIALLMIFM